MTSTIVLNQSNIEAGNTNNNVFVYHFPNSINFSNHEIAIQSVNMYYSWFNISNALNNNSFTYQWKTIRPSNITKNDFIEIIVTIPDGLYEISDINNYLQYIMMQKGHYLINSSGENVFYIEWILNPTLYCCQLNTYPVPTSLPSGYSEPYNFAGYPGGVWCPYVFITNDFNKIVGFPSKFGTSSSDYASTISVSYLSTQSPQVQPNPTLSFSISNVTNKYSNSNIVYTISADVGFGQQIIDKPHQFAFNSIQKGNHNQIRLSILGTNLQPIAIQDPNITIMLIIRSRKELTDDLVNALNGSK